MEAGDMQASDASAQKAATRRSCRLAGERDRQFQSLPASQATPRIHSHLLPQATADPPQPGTVLKVNAQAPTYARPRPFKSSADVPLYSYHSGTDRSNKENMELLYDRIKTNPRKATKKPLSNASQPRLKSSVKQSRRKQTSMDAPSSQNSLNSQRPLSPPAEIDSSITPSASSLPDPHTPRPEPECAFAPYVPPKITTQGENNELEAHTDIPRPPWASKRDRDENADLQSPAKRSRLIRTRPALELDIDALETARNPPSATVDSLKRPYLVAAASPGASQSTEDDKLTRTTPAVSQNIPPPLHIAPPKPYPHPQSKQDDLFVAHMLDFLTRQASHKTNNVGKRQARRILKLLKQAKPPAITEALFVPGEEARGHLQAGRHFEGPIFTQGEQPLPLQNIAGFLGEIYDDDVKVHIQDAGIKLEAPVHVREVTIGALKGYFQKKVKSPINCLELAAHVEDGIRPPFLNTEDCRLLTKLKHPSSGDKASRRGYEQGWKEVEKWALLAKAGALTEPHQDSHGYSTYITVNEGTVGFGWLSNPTTEQRAAWRKDPANFVDGEWRYVVLRPGRTVYFPAGTVHFVFRHPNEGDTLAFGGHVLRCSQIVRWAETLLDEKATKSQVTNEDLSVSAPEYLKRVEKFVLQARNTGTEWRWGGEDAIERFLKLKADFLAGEDEEA